MEVGGISDNIEGTYLKRRKHTVDAMQNGEDLLQFAFI